MMMYIGTAIFALFIIAGLCFMNMVMDVREDNRWDKEIRKEKRLKNHE